MVKARPKREKRMPEKWELKKARPDYLKAGAAPIVLDLAEAPYLFISGRGAPPSEAFENAIQSLYSVAYTLKFMGKDKLHDFAVGPLESQWFFDYDPAKLNDPSQPWAAPPETWRWNLLIQVPPDATALATAKKQTKRKHDLREIDEIELKHVTPGVCAQVLHLGPYESEPATFRRLDDWLRDRGLVHREPFHWEIYLSDPRRTKPERLKTILRVPVRPVEARVAQ